MQKRELWYSFGTLTPPSLIAVRPRFVYKQNFGSNLTPEARLSIIESHLSLHRDQVCEFHFERSGVTVPATHDVNGDFMCDQCFIGRHVLAEELMGDHGDGLAAQNSRTYFLRHRHAIYERRRAKRA